MTLKTLLQMSDQHLLRMINSFLCITKGLKVESVLNLDFTPRESFDLNSVFKLNYVGI